MISPMHSLHTAARYRGTQIKTEYPEKDVIPSDEHRRAVKKI